MFEPIVAGLSAPALAGLGAAAVVAGVVCLIDLFWWLRR